MSGPLQPRWRAADRTRSLAPALPANTSRRSRLLLLVLPGFHTGYRIAAIGIASIWNVLQACCACLNETLIVGPTRWRPDVPGPEGFPEECPPLAWDSHSPHLPTIGWKMPAWNWHRLEGPYWMRRSCWRFERRKKQMHGRSGFGRVRCRSLVFSCSRFSTLRIRTGGVGCCCRFGCAACHTAWRGS